MVRFAGDRLSSADQEVNADQDHSDRQQRPRGFHQRKDGETQGDDDQNSMHIHELNVIVYIHNWN